jgi:hypothetical protein
VPYSHGLIVEADNPKPIHPEFGTYGFDMIKRSIFKDRNFNPIAYPRELNTNQHTYANQLATRVKQLIEA